MNAWDRKDGEPLTDYIKRLEDFLNPNPPRTRMAAHDWVYRMRLRAARKLRAEQAEQSVQPPVQPADAAQQLSDGTVQ